MYSRLQTRPQPLSQLLQRHRPGEPEALPLAASTFLQESQLRLGFDPLGHGAHTQPLGDAENGLDDRLIAGVAGQARD